MIVNPEQVYLDVRVAGQVSRYHTWPRIREQSVGEHCWQLLRIYSCITDHLDHNFVMHCIYHDCAEVVTGDLPYPVKSVNPDIKRAVTELENDVMARQKKHWKPCHFGGLSQQDMNLFKLIEMVEMFEWGLDEVTRGNQYGMAVADRCLRVVYDKINSTAPLLEPYRRLCFYVYKRLAMCQIRLSQEWWNWSSWDSK